MENSLSMKSFSEKNEQKAVTKKVKRMYNLKSMVHSA